MTEPTGGADTSWFDQLPAGRIAQPAEMTAQPSQTAPQASAIPSWFDALPPGRVSPTQSAQPSQGFVDRVLNPTPLATGAPPPSGSQTIADYNPDVPYHGQEPVQMTHEQKVQSTGLLSEYGKGATLGMLPYVSAAVHSAAQGTSFDKALQAERDYLSEFEEQSPTAAAITEGAGSLVPTLAAFGAVNPIEAALIKRAAPYVGARIARYAVPALVQGETGADLGIASAAGHDIGSGQTDNLGSDVAKGAVIGGAFGAAAPAVGAVLQAVPNTARSVYQGGKSLFTNAGREGVAGQVLSESATNPEASVAQSPIPGLQLRTAQATGDRGLAELERTMAPPDVQNGRTSDQVNAIAEHLVGKDAGIDPQILVNDASAKGVQAVTNLDASLGKIEDSLWSNPALTSVKLNGPNISKGVVEDVAGYPASFRNAITGPQNKLGSFLREIEELGPDASIADINSVRSRLLSAARDARSGANPDSVTATAASRMASDLLERMGNDVAITGAPITVVQPRGATGLPIGYPKTVEAVPPNPDAWNAYQAARDFSRVYNKTLGYNEFDAILNPNAAGNIQGNPETQFGRFFDMNGGSSAGLLRLHDATLLARRYGATDAAQQAVDAADRYMRTYLLRGARAGNGIDMAGRPNMNLATLTSMVNKQMPAINESKMLMPSAQDILSAGNAAELLNRPAASRGDFNSTTYEKLKKNDLISAVLGQAGSTGLGAVAGGLAGEHYGPEWLPWYLRVAGGMLAGGFAGKMGASVAGKTLAHTPFVSGLITGPEKDILAKAMKGLTTPEERDRLLGMRLLDHDAGNSGRNTGAAATTVMRTAIPTESEPNRPSINPETGLPQFSLGAAQREIANRAVAQMHSHEATTAFVNQNKGDLRKQFGGQGIQRVHQIGALLRRADAPTVFSLVRQNPSPALRKALDAHHIDDDRSLAAVAIMLPNLAKVLATRTNRTDLTKSGEAQVIAALR